MISNLVTIYEWVMCRYIVLAVIVELVFVWLCVNIGIWLCENGLDTKFLVMSLKQVSKLKEERESKLSTSRENNKIRRK